MGLVVVVAAAATANACGGGHAIRIIRAYRAPPPRIVYAPQQPFQNPPFTSNGMPFQGVPNGQLQCQPQFQGQQGQPNQFQGPDANSQALEALQGSPMPNGFQDNPNLGPQNNMMAGPQNNQFQGQPNQF